MIKVIVIMGSGLMAKSNKAMVSLSFQLCRSRRRNGWSNIRGIGRMISFMAKVFTVMRMEIGIKESLKMVKPTARVHLLQ